MSEGREETNHTRSPSEAGNKLQLSQRDVESQAEGLKELTSSLLPMVAKSKTDIKLKDLYEREITAWGDAVETYESRYGDWDRPNSTKKCQQQMDT